MNSLFNAFLFLVLLVSWRTLLIFPWGSCAGYSCHVHKSIFGGSHQESIASYILRDP